MLCVVVSCYIIYDVILSYIILASLPSESRFAVTPDAVRTSKAGPPCISYAASSSAEADRRMSQVKD